MDTGGIGRAIILFGIILIGVGTLLVLAGKIPYLGRLPGDIYIQKKNCTFYFPLATSLLVSAALTVLFWIFSRR